MASSVAIQYKTDYAVDWRYNSSTGKFARFVNNRPHNDPETGDQLRADTVVVQKTIVTIVDSYGRRHIQTIGSGEAIVFRQGIMIEGTWQKNSLEGRTRFYDAEGEEIGFTPGQTWIQVVPLKARVETK